MQESMTLILSSDWLSQIKEEIKKKKQASDF